LTAREKEILTFMAQGLNNKDIAEHLSISLFTVKNHVSNIIQKLAVDDRTQAALLALKKGLI
jgi:NarL family two-component system response regulator LiaR